MKIPTLATLLLTIVLAAPLHAAVTLESDDTPVGESVTAENPAKPANRHPRPAGPPSALT